MARILLVDDDDLLLELLDFKLSARGFEVVKATDAVRGMALIQKIKPDLVVLDAVMPGFDGLMAMRQLRGDPLTADIPVVILTEKLLRDESFPALQAGARDYLAKPFLPEELLTRVQRILNQGSAVDGRAIA